MSFLEILFAQQLEQAGIWDVVREYRFCPPRKWAFDFAWPSRGLAVEIEGGLWIRGRHNNPASMIRDMEKYNTAALLGWCILRFHGGDVDDGQALEWTRYALDTKRPAPLERLERSGPGR